MKTAEREEDPNMIRSDMWLDTESYRSGDRQLDRQGSALYYQDPDIENLSRFEEEEEKLDSFFPSFIHALKNGDTLEKVKKLTEDYKTEIKAEYRPMLIHLIVLYDKKEFYEPINEYFDEISGNINMENKLVEQELPEEYEELVSNESEMSNVREKSLKL